MEQKLRILYNTLLTIETKGENTKTMAACLNYVQQLIAEVNAAQASTTESAEKGE